ncbi:MAG: hypothetical protein A2887_06125 [Alphaproteobacteria bacterium RIFCSPLOWO2_01_FULL_40_26]|nr:MAG: hypothetical protein A3D15_06290 [Alphaproteobacteria bacterium RIFCSPHIGHO2_02_FULL_40_34]OFW89093.1 MAG: hypothetical protein A2794_02265 [Alphaproteobacteria bacterium RIFCSPHIGHO2_01_FULL_40_8]OFW94131.1 MAG: hypothetical protein A2887_06125 [Alphaproteobacteria bacterium RIFCSPLOWO2_01_FULL_40_26]OFX09375.1 MAG: hypothetical protein A3H30_01820 [Alphaproteobacteria bacterium RIFCSPLOWO2_02_FULL_40_19]OFX10972.1 MAG: hypothetical protein A3G22_00800 [Alphaproteobacteria bacterium RI
MFDENSYRQNKQKNLLKIISDLYDKPRWIWIESGSRRRMTFQIDYKNRLGFFAEKSHDLVEISEDKISIKEISGLIPYLKKFLKTQEESFFTKISVTLFDSGLALVFTIKRKLNFKQNQQLVDFGKAHNLNISCRIKNDSITILQLHKNQIFYPDFKIDLDCDIFIQATKSGLEAIIKIIREIICEGAVIKAARIADVYAGFGAYSFAIHDLAKSIYAFEGDEKMVDLITKNSAQNNLKAKITAKKRDLFFNPLTKSELKDFDVVIINPPRNGASPQISEIAKSSLKNLIYISCNPQSFVRDVKILIDAGYKIANLTAIDQFHATKHLELVAIVQKN